jgi:hypothetical protein
MNSLFKELSQTFPIENVEPYGEVLVIPVKAFKPEWKSQLEAEGVQTYTNAYMGQACFFLRKKMQNQTVLEAEKPQKPKNVWTKQEEQLLLKLYNEGVAFNEICKRLNKTRTQVMGKISSFKKQQKMKHAGNLKPQTLKVESEANADPSFRELLEACLTLYPNHVNICRFLLDKAGEMLKP